MLLPTAQDVLHVRSHMQEAYRFLHTHVTFSKESLGCCNTELTCRCAREVYGIAKTNWDAFIGPDIVDLYGHLLIYPMVVNQDGRYTSLP